MPNESQSAPDGGPRHKAQLMRAMVAACALVARADGLIEVSERQRIFRLFRALPVFDGFARAEVEAEFERREREFAYEPYSAREHALDVIEALEANPEEARMLLAACQKVLEADGVAREAEYKALSDIGRALGEP